MTKFLLTNFGCEVSKTVYATMDRQKTTFIRIEIKYFEEDIIGECSDSHLSVKWAYIPLKLNNNSNMDPHLTG